MLENSISRKVKIMEEIGKRKIVQHNDLITSVAKMDKTPLKIFELAASCVDAENPPNNEVVYLSKEELFTFFDVNDTNKYSRFKKSIETMQRQSFFEIKQVSDKGFDFKSIVPITTVSWNNYDDEVMIKFNTDIIPYLMDLKKNFTQYAIKDVMNLSSKHSIVLYKWLSMNYNQYEYYRNKSNRSKSQLDYYKNPIISMKLLRELTDTKDTYNRVANFTNRVLDESLQEITQKTVFNVEYKKIKKGRKIAEIQFFISEKPVAKNEFYKEEQQDPAFLEEKEKEEIDENYLFSKAVESNYTTLLEEYGLINSKDFRDKEVMAGLQRNVFPLYDKLEQQKGIGSIDKHISYVASRKKDYSRKNIVRYLQVAVENYLSNSNKD